MFFYIYLDAATPSRWRWTLYAGNNRKIANSGESYVNHADCVAAVNLVAASDGKPIRYSATASARLARLRT